MSDAALRAFVHDKRRLRVSWQNIANMIGWNLEDVRAAFDDGFTGHPLMTSDVSPSARTLHLERAALIQEMRRYTRLITEAAQRVEEIDGMMRVNQPQTHKKVRSLAGDGLQIHGRVSA